MTRIVEMRRRWGDRVLLGAGLVFLAACQLSWIDEPFDLSIGGNCAGADYALAMQAFEAHGVVACSLGVSAFYHPASTAIHVPDLHHPWLPATLLYPWHRALGGGERALRIPLLIGLLLVALLLSRIVHPEAPAPTAGLAALLLCTAPVVVQYGDLPATAAGLPMMAMVVGLSAWRHHRRWGSRTSLALWLVAGLLAAMTDWLAFALVPALWVDVFLDREPRRGRRRAAMLAALPFALGFALFFAWRQWATGRAALASRYFEGPRELWEVYVLAIPRWPGALAGHLASGFGPALLAVAAIGLAITAGRLGSARRTALDRLVAVTFVAGLVPCLVFWGHAIVHPYFVMSLAPCVAIAAARVLVPSTPDPARPAGLRRAARALAAILVVTLTALQSVALHDEFRGTARRDRGLDLARAVSPTDVVLLPGAYYAVMYYSGIPVLPAYGLDDLRHQVEFLRPARDEIGAVWLGIPTKQLPAHEAWLPEAPLRRETARRVPFGPDELLLVQVDL